MQSVVSCMRPWTLVAAIVVGASLMGKRYCVSPLVHVCVGGRYLASGRVVLGSIGVVLRMR